MNYNHGSLFLQGVTWEEQWLHLRLEVENKRDKKTMVEKFAENEGHKVLFLPVYSRTGIKRLE